MPDRDATDRGAAASPMDTPQDGRTAERVHFGPCNFCGQNLVRLPNNEWGVRGDKTARNCPHSPDGWHQANRLCSDGSFSIGSDLWPGLSKAIEEAGEFLQVAGKIIATHGTTDHWDGTDLRVRLIEEAGDLLGALDFLGQMNLSPHERVQMSARAEGKRRQFFTWQDEQKDHPDA